MFLKACHEHGYKRLVALSLSTFLFYSVKAADPPYFHNINETKLEADADNSELEIPHSIVAIDNVIYIAENRSADKGVIRRFSAISNSEMTPLNVTVTDENCTQLAKKDFYITKDDAGHLIAVFDQVKPSAPLLCTTSLKFCWGIVDTDSGEVSEVASRDFTYSLNVNALRQWEWIAIGRPAVSGDLTSDNWKILAPVTLHKLENTTQFLFAYIVTNDGGTQYRCFKLDDEGISEDSYNVANRSSFTAVYGNYFISDDVLNPAYLREIDTPCHLENGVLNESETSADVSYFEYDNEKYLIYGNADGTYTLNKWTQIVDTPDWTDVSFVATLGQKSSAVYSEESPELYSAVSYLTGDNGQKLVHLHLYSPGNYLQTIQMSTSQNVVGLDAPVVDNVTVNVSSSEISFDGYVSEARITDLSGRQLLYETGTDRLQVSALQAGIYILSYKLTPDSVSVSLKIEL